MSTKNCSSSEWPVSHPGRWNQVCHSPWKYPWVPKLNSKYMSSQSWREIAVVLFFSAFRCGFQFSKTFLLKCVRFLWEPWTLILLVFKEFPGWFCRFWTPIRDEVSRLNSDWRHLQSLWCKSMQTTVGFGPMNSVANTEISQMFPGSIFSQSLFMDTCWWWKDEVWYFWGSKIKNIFLFLSGGRSSFMCLLGESAVSKIIKDIFKGIMQWC